MIKNIAIVLLVVALATCLVWYGNSILYASALRASSRNVRLASDQVWSQACQHAAAGSPEREKWCEWAAQQTTVSAAVEGVTEDDQRSLALAQIERAMFPERSQPANARAK